MQAGLVNVVLVGGTGRFGSRVARALLARPDVNLRLLVRPGKDPDALGDLTDRGATVLEGDLGDEAALDAALDGAHAVVSTVHGGPEVMVDGQLRLLRAAKRAGVQRFLPSDYTLDYFALSEGESVLADMRRHVAREVEKSGVGHTFVLVGGFMEVALSPREGLFDFAAGRAFRWGTGEELFDVTSLEDAAHLVAAVVDDPRAHNRRVEFAGDVVNFNSVVAHFEELTGRQVEVVERGTLADFAAHIARQRAQERPAWEYVFEQLLLAQLSGKAKLYHPANSDYPQVVPVRVRDFLAHHYGPVAAAEVGGAGAPA